MSENSPNSEAQRIKNALSAAGPAVLVEKFQDIAADLLKFHHITTAFAEEYAQRNPASPGDEEENAAPEKGELRCYYLCPFTLRNVNTLLEEEGVDSLQDLLGNIHTSLCGFTLLLENIQPEAELKGFVLHILARELKRIENLLLRVHDAYDTADRIDLSS